MQDLRRWKKRNNSITSVLTLLSVPTEERSVVPIPSSNKVSRTFSQEQWNSHCACHSSTPLPIYEPTFHDTIVACLSHKTTFVESRTESSKLCELNFNTEHIYCGCLNIWCDLITLLLSNYQPFLETGPLMPYGNRSGNTEGLADYLHAVF